MEYLAGGSCLDLVSRSTLTPANGCSSNQGSLLNPKSQSSAESFSWGCCTSTTKAKSTEISKLRTYSCRRMGQSSWVRLLSRTISKSS